jgi:hypothetical protein
VAASRNDGHGVHALQRTQAFIDGLGDHARRFRRTIELILVEWNPPPDKPGLADVLSVPSVAGFTVKIVIVPPQIHQNLGGPERLAFYQMIAKNVGIRRAAGDAVLATNIDILLSDELFLKATGPLEDGRVYRADRFDIPFDPASSIDPVELRCSRPIRIHRRNGIEHPDNGVSEPHIIGLGGLVSQLFLRPSLLVRKVFAPSAHNGPAGLPRLRRGFIKVFFLPTVHGNACGDFTLMTKSSWLELRGYPEWVMHSWSLDSLLLYQAAAAGYQFIDFQGSQCLHLDHSGGWTPDADEKLFKMLQRNEIFLLPSQGLIDVAYAMWRAKPTRAWMTNTLCWGLGDYDLVESSPMEVTPQ